MQEETTTKLQKENEMIKFDRINGTLCRMVEPTPLTEKSLTHYTPCVIRPIKDNTQIGKLNKRTIYDGLRNCNGVYILNERQIGTGSNKNMIHTPWGSGHNFEQFEIIGFPVEEGSHWWALYQLMQGNVVRHINSKPIYFDGEYVWCDNVVLSYIKDFLSKAEPSGWQIYKEPKPEPAKEQFNANQEIDNLKAQIAKLQADNRSLVDQVNQMALMR